jgi:hypothetical protein
LRECRGRDEVRSTPTARTRNARRPNPPGSIRTAAPRVQAVDLPGSCVVVVRRLFKRQALSRLVALVGRLWRGLESGQPSHKDDPGEYYQYSRGVMGSRFFRCALRSSHGNQSIKAFLVRLPASKLVASCLVTRPVLLGLSTLQQVRRIKRRKASSHKPFHSIPKKSVNPVYVVRSYLRAHPFSLPSLKPT